MSITHKFGIGGHEGYITVGLYPNGAPGEIFIRMAKEGSTISGLMDSFATAISLALQHGVPLKVLCEKFAHTRFEPSGWTGSEELGYAKSIMDYLFRWMQLRFLSGQQLDLFANLKQPTLAALSQPTLYSTPTSSPMGEAPASTSRLSTGAPASSVISTGAQRSGETPVLSSSDEAPGSLSGPATHELHGEAFQHNDRTPPQQGIAPDLAASNGIASSGLSSFAEGGGSASHPLATEDRSIYHTASAMQAMYNMGDAPSCSTCGSIMTRNGSCYRCMECGSTSGCS
jgi:ribonucleoside-diphosphate reductase alpha chain